LGAGFAGAVVIGVGKFGVAVKIVVVTGAGVVFVVTGAAALG
jgi:hypothetical protein